MERTKHRIPDDVKRGKRALGDPKHVGKRGRQSSIIGRMIQDRGIRRGSWVIRPKRFRAGSTTVDGIQAKRKF